MFLHKKTIFHLYNAALQAGTAFCSCRQKKQVLFFGLLACFISSIAQVQSPKFTRLTTNEGLSQGHVSAILKDKKGFMWFATSGGLNKYDGNKFVAYKHDADNPASISNNIVSDVMEDKDGNLWAATNSSLDKLDRAKDCFVHYQPGNGHINTVFQDSKKRIWAGLPDGLFVLNSAAGTFKNYKHSASDTNSLSDNFIYDVTEDNNGDMWIATKNGLNRLNPVTGQFIRYKNEPKNKNSISGDWIRAVYKDTKGNVWAGTLGNGICMYDRKNDRFINYKHDPKNSNSLCLNDILSFCEDDNGNLWVGTENGGISVCDIFNNRFINYKNDLYNPNSLSNNSIYCIYKDNLQNIWIGTYSEGVNFLPRSGDKFLHYNQNVNNNTGLNDHNILALAGNGSKEIWIGTDGGGLNKFDRKTHSFTHYLNDENNKNTLNSNYVLSVIRLNKDLLCLGLLRNGFDIFNTKTGKFYHHVPKKGNTYSLSTSTVNTLCKSHNGNVWIGTWGGGLNYFDIKKKSFIRYENNPLDSNSITSNFIFCLHEDKEGTLWIGTGEGLDKLDKATGKFIHYKHSDNDKKSISHNFVEYIFSDEADNLWLGTGGGLNLFDRKSKTFTAYTEKEGLASNTIKSILQDNNGNLWLASFDGLSRFNPVTKAIRNYTQSDGLQGKEFKARSCFQTDDGEMFFGGTNGFNAFYPDSLKDNSFVPPIYLTSFQIFNKEVEPAGDFTLQEQISEAKEINLSYRQSFISFGFAALNYNLPDKNQYAYKLEGFDKEWIYTGNKRTATYTNLDPGTYILHVKGSNNDGLWNEKGTSVTITILPPFWLTWWFKLGAILLVIGSAAWFYHFRMNIVRRQKIKLEQKVHEQTLQLISSNEEERKARREADQANSAKSVFLATMSHEIRTPMNGVIGMASLLMQTGLNEEQYNYAKIISTCGENLLSVINGILDFSKIESGKMELENKLFNLKTCVEEVLEIFSFKASEAGIKLGYKIAGGVPAYITGDCLRLRQVLINLVANALKFTNQGEVFINIYTVPQVLNANLALYFEVHDTGIGISAHKLERLFKAFTQVDSSTTRKYGGTGLGLVICEKLVALMGGNIKVASELGKGSTFTFNIQTTATNLLPDQNSSLSPANSRNTTFKKQVLSANFSALHPMQILIAEDNAINAIIITEILIKLGYSTLTAANGHEVLTMLNYDSYDLILMDMQMPEMDGLEATSIIRKCCDNQPVIIAMTANAMEDDRKKCIEAGMDDYLSKPINLDTLMSMLAKWNDKIKTALQEVTDPG